MKRVERRNEKLRPRMTFESIMVSAENRCMSDSKAVILLW
jgi:hypothetical protein